MAMSDRIVVMWGGEIAQEGRPADIYRHPKSRFVADFIGRSNILPFQASRTCEGGTEVTLNGAGLRLVVEERQRFAGEGFVCIRPESVQLARGGQGQPAVNALSGRLRHIVDLGAQVELTVELAPDLLLLLVLASSRTASLPAVGEVLHLSVAPEDIRLLSA